MKKAAAILFALFLLAGGALGVVGCDEPVDDEIPENGELN